MENTSDLEWKCQECNKWVSTEEFAYGHDCEDE